MTVYDEALLAELDHEERMLLSTKPAALNENERQLRRRLQNRLAAQNSRSKKRQHTNELEETTQNLQQQYEEAKLTTAMLRKQINSLYCVLSRLGAFQDSKKNNPNALPSNNTRVYSLDAVANPESVLSLHEWGLKADLLRGLPIPSPGSGLLDHFVPEPSLRTSTASRRNAATTAVANPYHGYGLESDAHESIDGDFSLTTGRQSSVALSRRTTSVRRSRIHNVRTTSPSCDSPPSSQPTSAPLSPQCPSTTSGSPVASTTAFPSPSQHTLDFSLEQPLDIDNNHSPKIMGAMTCSASPSFYDIPSMHNLNAVLAPPMLVRNRVSLKKTMPTALTLSQPIIYNHLLTQPLW